MRTTRIVMLAASCLLIAAAAEAQSVGQILKKATDAIDEMVITDAEEQQIGADISAMLRDKYGVVQDAAVHKYVTLVGSVLSSQSTRPNLRWTFIVLDTDGVNAFAVPGGFIHITKGALALIKSEAELADVLGHEIGHVTAKHSINAISKSKGISAGLSATLPRNQLMQELAKRGYAIILENKFDRNQETSADGIGVGLANKAGYAPTQLSAFLTKLADRNAGMKERSGVFASHPETKSRLDSLTKLIAKDKLTAAAMVQARYQQHIKYQLVPVGQIAQVAPPSTATDKPAEPKKSGSGAFGVGGLGSLGKENAATSTTASAGSRGVNTDRDARGGPNKALVVVSVTAAEIAEFRKGITG